MIVLVSLRVLLYIRQLNVPTLFHMVYACILYMYIPVYAYVKFNVVLKLHRASMCSRQTASVH